MKKFWWKYKDKRLWETFLFTLIVVMTWGCSQKKKEIPDNVLLQFGEQSLTIDEIVSHIPQGITGADSAALFDKMVDTWIKDVVLSDFAAERLYDVAEIDRKVKDYRNGLIVQEYISRMMQSRSPSIDEIKIKDYYDSHRNELRLEVPLIKGIFLKINSSATGKDEIKRLLTSKDPDKIDKLEQTWMDRALEYNYFRDNWVDWETISGMIPYRFGNPDVFLNENKYFETEFEDCRYYLQISDYLPSGAQQPYEFAKSWISMLLTQGELAEYERELINSLVEKSIKEKKLDVIGYDPVRHEFLKKHVKEDND